MISNGPALTITNRLVRLYPAEEVWLFGSQARGDSGPDSDWDLLAVVNDSDLPGYQRARMAHEIVADVRVPKDIVVMTQFDVFKKSVGFLLPFATQFRCPGDLFEPPPGKAREALLHATTILDFVVSHLKARHPVSLAGL